MSKSNLVQDLLSRTTNSTKQKCGYTRIKESMTDEEQQALSNIEEAIQKETGNGRSRTFSGTWLSEVLKKNGHQISASTVLRHFNGRCGCE